MKKILRKWLKRRIIKLHNPLGQQIFKWIYGSPVTTWKDKLLCVKYDPDLYKETYDWLVESR